MSELQLKKIADLAGKEPGIYEGTDGRLIYAVAIGATGVGIETRPAGVTPEPPPTDEWKEVKALDILTPEKDQIQILYAAQPRAVEMRVRLKWTPLVELTDEYEPFALVRRKGTAPVWNDLLFLFVLRGGNSRWRTGVDVVMDEKATDERRWKPKAKSSYYVTASVDLEGTARLEIDGPAAAWLWTTTRPEDGRPGPWPWDPMLQLGGPAGKAAGHKFEDVIFEVREEA